MLLLPQGKIIRATRAHLNEIAEIIADNFDRALPEHSPAVKNFCKSHSTAEQLREEFSWREMYVYINSANVVLGTGALVNFGSAHKPKWCVSNLFVKVEYHGKGIGKLLLENLFAQAQKKRTHELFVPSSRTAVAFYRKFGFATLPPIEQPADDIALEITWMRKQM